MGIIRYGKTAQIGVYPGNQSGRFISYRKTGVGFPLDPDTTAAWQFAKNKSLTDTVGGLTLDFTRSSTATYFDSDGNRQTAAIDEPRFDHDPVTKKSLGLLIEEARTNLFLNSGAPVTQDITTTAQDYTIWVEGTGDITVSGTATGVATEGNPLTVTATAGTMTCTVNGSLSIAQVEAGRFPTSYIPTAGASATRADDDCSTTDVSWYSGIEGTFYAQFQMDFTGFNRGLIFEISDSVSSSPQVFMLPGVIEGDFSNQFVGATDGAGGWGYFSGTNALDNATPNKWAGAIAQNDVIQYINGVAQGTDTSSDVPGSVSPMQLLGVGSRQRGANILHITGTISEFGYADVRKDNAFLADLTTL